MSSGRTVWWPKDAAWWRREGVVELGEEFGPAGPAIIDWLSCESKAQNAAGGTVKAGFRATARGCFTDLVTVRHVVSRAVELGVLKDLAGDDRVFTCRVSGLRTDLERVGAAARKAQQRALGSAGSSVDKPDPPDGTERDGPGHAVTERDGRDALSRERKGKERKEEQQETTSVAASDDRAVRPVDIDEARQRLQAAQVDRIWAAYIDARVLVLGAKSQPRFTVDRRRRIARQLREWSEQDLLDAVRGWRHSPHNRGENDRGQHYCDIELILRDAAHIEKFRDLERSGGTKESNRASREEALAERLWPGQPDGVYAVRGALSANPSATDDEIRVHARKWHSDLESNHSTEGTAS